MSNEQNQLEHYKKIFGTGDVATRSYRTLVKILEQQVEYLDTFKIKDLIVSDDTAKKIEYKNAKELWEGMTDMILKLNEVKAKLSIEYIEKEDEIKPISAKQIANGNV